ncbi:LON peptidase substrate-binding domain-containing protein, partial [candidate division KSB1 bacterium]|nr:LON peptidase substrate-binding domain-containing protein [candidate division KSB1 bacterium]
MRNKETITTQIPIFPLPNVVFFPKTFLPLHIFEPRYRKMAKDSKSNDNLIGMALLKEGWEKQYHDNPDVHEIACVGKIQHIERLEDGRYNILLYGLSRVKIMKFIQGKPYRMAQVKYLKDIAFDHDDFNENYEAENFLNLVQSYLREMGVENLEKVNKLHNHSLESVINQVTSALDFPTQQKQELLQIDTLEQRYDRLKKLLQEQFKILKISKNVKYIPEDPS